MKEKPIIFKGELIRAIIQGKKTQTRRVIKPQPDHCHDFGQGLIPQNGDDDIKNPYDGVTELWVRETFVIENTDRIPTDGRPYRQGEEYEGELGNIATPHYRATEPEPHIVPFDQDSLDDRTRWTPSIFMPRWASRLQLRVKGVRVERLQDISEEDSIKEGVREVTKDGSLMKYCIYDLGNYSSVPWQNMPRTAKEVFKKLWESINKKRGFGWDTDPFLWVVEFEVKE